MSNALYAGIGFTLPAGSNTHIQFNDSGAFGNDSDFTWTKANNTFVAGNLQVTNASTSLTVFNKTANGIIKFQGGTGSSNNGGIARFLGGDGQTSFNGGDAVFAGGNAVNGNGGSTWVIPGISSGSGNNGDVIIGNFNGNVIINSFIEGGSGRVTIEQTYMPVPSVSDDGRFMRYDYDTASYVLDDVATVVTNLSDATNITVPLSHSRITHIYQVTLTDDRTMDNPSGTTPSNGQLIEFKIKQNNVGSNTIVWDTQYRFSSSTPEPTLSTTANALDRVLYEWNSVDSKWDCLAYIIGY